MFLDTGERTLCWHCESQGGLASLCPSRTVLIQFVKTNMGGFFIVWWRSWVHWVNNCGCKGDNLTVLRTVKMGSHFSMHCVVVTGSTVNNGYIQCPRKWWVLGKWCLNCFIVIVNVFFHYTLYNILFQLSFSVVYCISFEITGNIKCQNWNNCSLELEGNNF